MNNVLGGKIVGKILSVPTFISETGFVRVFGYANRGNTFFNTHLPSNCEWYYMVYKVDKKGNVIEPEYIFVPDKELEECLITTIK